MTKQQEMIWVGKEEEISFGYKSTRIKIRAFNITSKSGPVVLQKNITCSKHYLRVSNGGKS